MSKKENRVKKKKPSTAREPWEQSIYETNYAKGNSRLGQREQQKKGNTLFLTILVILLLLIISLPIGTYLYITRDASNDKQTTQTTSTVADSLSSSEETSLSTTQDTVSSSTQESTQFEDGQTAEAAYAEVLSGEGPASFADRNGITLEELYNLNGLTDESILQVGQSLRIR